MADCFKVEKDAKGKNYLIVPTSHLLESYEASNFPFCYTSFIVDCYNFSLSDFYRYLISKFNAKIPVDKKYPYFKTQFPERSKAQQFCDELNSRMIERKLL